MAVRRFVVVALMVASMLASIEQHLDRTQTTNQQASRSSVYWGAYIDGVPFDMKILETFESRTEKKVSIIHWGQPWMMGGKYQKFQTAEFDKVRAHGAIPMLNWGSWHVGYGKDQPEFQLQDIYGGKHDSYIRQWAQDAKAWGHPLFLRFNHEMNGWWYPWSEQVNGNRPGDFVKAWKHVHDLFTEAGAENVTWVWCVNRVESPKSTPAEDLYPGDEYVDWVAMDAYNAGPDEEYKWQPFYDVFKPTYDKLESLAPSKPIMIAEVASSEGDDPANSKADWIRDALINQLPENFPNVKAIVWFNWDAGDERLDWPLESSSEAMQAFIEGIASPYYTTNSFWCITTRPIPVSEYFNNLNSADPCSAKKSGFEVFIPLIDRIKNATTGY